MKETSSEYFLLNFCHQTLSLYKHSCAKYICILISNVSYLIIFSSATLPFDSAYKKHKPHQ